MVRKPASRSSQPISPSSPYYDAIAAGYDELHGEEQLRKYRIIARELALPPGSRVLDVGAGTGIGNQVIPGMVGTDPSPGLLSRHPHKESVVSPAEALPFPDGSFDAVLCVTAIHHTDYRKAVAEMRRVSRGPLAVTVLRKSPQAQEIVAFLSAELAPVRIIPEEKDWIVVHAPRNA